MTKKTVVSNFFIFSQIFFVLNIIFYSSDSLDEMNNKSKIFHVNLKKIQQGREKKKKPKQKLRKKGA